MLQPDKRVKLFDPQNPAHEMFLQREVVGGYASRRLHPQDPKLAIYNYTKRAQAEGRWNFITRQARGLIIRYGDGGEVVARPFAKFFNLGEYPEGTFGLDVPVAVSSKEDGSLGVLYPAPHPSGGWAIATRGSFESEQAIRGTEMLREAVRKGFRPRSDCTYLFEIVYPENRIVVDYGDRSELILLEILDTATGDPIYDEQASVFFARPTRWFGTLRQVLDLPDRPNAEGWVVRLPDGVRVKIKQEDYIRLHRIVTGLNERVVWDFLRRSRADDLSDLKADLPEEFHDWVDRVGQGLVDAYRAIDDSVDEDFEAIADEAFGGWIPMDLSRDDRATFAEIACRKATRPLLFLALDDKWDQYRDVIWRMVKPS